MALQKDETLPQGITLAYHRILKYTVELPKVHVTLAGYVSEDLRNQEKELLSKQAELAELQSQIEEAQSESGFDPEADNPELAELGDQYNQLSLELTGLNSESLYVRTADVDVEVDGEATREAIYTALKALPAFTDATDC